MDNVEDLHKGVNEDLARLELDVQYKVNLAQRYGEVIRQVVVGWLKKVETLRNKQTELRRGAGAISSCFKGLFCARNLHGKAAKKEFDTIIKILNEGKSFTAVSDPAPLPVMLFEDFEAFESRRSIKSHVLQLLKKDSTYLIGIYGMGGVGKTTLMKEVYNEVIQTKLFDEAVMVVVTRNPDLKEIQSEIAEKLGLKFEEESIIARARQLFARLKKANKILIILDDLWSEEDLAALGIPHRHDHKGCKVMVTSRSPDVCSQMGSQINIEVKILSDTDSWQLFRRKAGDAVDTDALKVVSMEITNECKGVPLAIVIIGKALLNKDVHIWIDAAQQLKKSNYHGMSTVNASIKYSYDNLQNIQAKSCFLLCCMFPEDYGITIDKVLSYAIGENCFKDVDSLEKTRLKVHVVIDKLLVLNFLLKGEKDGHFMMHDVVRDVAVTIATEEGNNNSIIKAGLGLIQWPIMKNIDRCVRLSLMKNGITELPDQPNCTELLSLSLSHNDFTIIPSRFFECMKGLVTLDLSSTQISALPLSISGLENLRMLNLCNCSALKDVSQIGHLSKLEILNLEDTGLDSLPKEFGGLVNLKLLNLHTTGPCNITQDVIVRMSLLEELYMKANGCFSDLVEMASLANLTNLFLVLRNCGSDSGKLLSRYVGPCKWKNLTEFQVNAFYTSKLFTPVYSRSLALTVKRPESIADWVKMLVESAEELFLAECYYLRNLAEFSMLGFNNIRSLEIRDCENMDYLIRLDKRVSGPVFSLLETLYLGEMKSLRAFSNRQLPIDSLKRLKALKIIQCTIYYDRFLVGLHTLESISLFNCLVVHRIGEKATRLGSLLIGRKMYIYNCRMRNLFPHSMGLTLQDLEKLMIKKCDELLEIVESQEEHVLDEVHDKTTIPSSIKSSALRNSGQLPSFSSLRKVVVMDCGSLKCLFPMYVVSSLQQLEVIIVAGCRSLEVLFAESQEEEVESDLRLSFPGLRILALFDLENLACFFYQEESQVLDLPALKTLRIVRCPELKRIPISSQSADKMEIFTKANDMVEPREWEDINDILRLESLLSPDTTAEGA